MRFFTDIGTNVYDFKKIILMKLTNFRLFHLAELYLEQFDLRDDNHRLI